MRPEDRYTTLTPAQSAALTAKVKANARYAHLRDCAPGQANWRAWATAHIGPATPMPRGEGR